jgi:hypothetical protein
MSSPFPDTPTPALLWPGALPSAPGPLISGQRHAAGAELAASNERQSLRHHRRHSCDGATAVITRRRSQLVPEGEQRRSTAITVGRGVAVQQRRMPFAIHTRN